MAKSIGQIHVKRERGIMTVIGMGSTPRGQRFINARAALNVKTAGDPNFKKELAIAVSKMLDESFSAG